MNIRYLPIAIFALSAAFVCHASDLTVEGDLTVGNSTEKGGIAVNGETGSSAAPGIVVNGDGGVVFKGTLLSGTIPASGSGVRMMWHPLAAAFRAGIADGDQWDFANVGIYSTVLGYGMATAPYSAAIGGGYATGWGAFVAGGGNASASFSASLASGDASGVAAFACSLGVAAGDSSFAASEGEVYGVSAAALNGGLADGEYSLAVGLQSLADGDFSAAIGKGVVAAYENTFAVGAFNESSVSAIDSSEQLFVVGNGTGNTSDPPEVKNRNALTVYKNGNVSIPKRQGDILMGEFGNPE